MKSLRVMLGHEEPPKARLKSKFEFTAAGVERIMEQGERAVPQKVFATNTIYASSLGYITVKDHVLNYFDPKPKTFPANVSWAMALGTASHNFIQERLMRAGVLYPKPPEGEPYKEVRVECPEYRLVGKIDGLVSEEQLKDFGSTKWSTDSVWVDRPLKMDLLEIKAVNSFNYRATQGPEDISKPYRMQATAMQKMAKYDRTIMMYVDRDSLKFRFIEYKAEESLWDEIKQLSTDIFRHLKDLSMPEGIDQNQLPPGMSWDQWVNMKIEQSPKRKWFHLLDNNQQDEEYEQQTLPFFLN